MIASAVRSAADPTPENLAKADAWADRAIAAVLPRIYQGFGVVQLMALRRVAWSTFYFDTIIDGGRYGFHTLDEKAFRLQLPCDEGRFLGNEAIITEPLRYDQTEKPETSTQAHLKGSALGISAYLIRTAAARRRALFFAFRASHKEDSGEKQVVELATLEAEIEHFVSALPRRFHLTNDNLFLHRERLGTFILLHVLRHNLFIIVGRASLQIFQRDLSKSDLIPQVRQKRISHALPIASLLSEALKAGIALDPQLGVHAYIALESWLPVSWIHHLEKPSLIALEILVLLFEPRRLAEIDPLVDPKSPQIMEAIPHLLTVLRSLSFRAEFVKHLYVEAVHRLLRFECNYLLSQEDIAAFRRQASPTPISKHFALFFFWTYSIEYRILGQETAELDFREFRWAKIERLRRGAKYSANTNRDEDLLEYNVGGDTAAPSAAPSPRLDAIDVSSSMRRSSAALLPAFSGLPSTSHEVSEPHPMDASAVAQADPKWTIPSNMMTDNGQAFPLDWAWLLEEPGHQWDETGDPTIFWNQLQQL
ncbi:unnamed protein product [Clonostachys byssicola]|uniref:Transcription factor domain-containing protein n=1 Tax=Clonostachys byssicola TaxID=160290 RepID=A0A9N9ULQ5_9HYPO|nr:unnamed protein product [Clonostachys byssicola]